MKKIFRIIRRVRVINYPVRNLIRFFTKTQAYWPVSGIINCRFENISFKLFSKCDDPIAEYFFYRRPFHETKILRLISRFAEKSNCIVDIGANTGVHSVISGISNPGCKIFSVEPYIPNYKRLEINRGLNNCTNINLITNALGSSRGELKFFVPSDNSITDVSSAVDLHGNRIYPELKWKETIVQQITLDDLVQQTGPVDFFKCDVESFEIEVIKGGMNFFETSRPPFIIEICLDEAKCTFFNEFAAKYNYKVYFISEDGLFKLDAIRNFDKWPNFLFTQYNHPNSFIGNSEQNEFIENCMQKK
jgi:FkbM family methyltransferase